MPHNLTVYLSFSKSSFQTKQVVEQKKALALIILGKKSSNQLCVAQYLQAIYKITQNYFFVSQRNLARKASLIDNHRSRPYSQFLYNKKNLYQFYLISFLASVLS